MEISICKPWSLTDGARYDLAVVIDVLRATTTASFLCEHGGRLIVVPSPGELDQLGSPADHTVFSELKLEERWRQLDNSPTLARAAQWTGAPVLVTTNGTQAIAAALAAAEEVVLACFANIEASAELIRRRAPARLAIVPAGFEPRHEPRHEDEVCARALEQMLGGAGIDIARDAAATCWNEERAAGRLARKPALRGDFELALTPGGTRCVPLARRDGDRILAERAE